MPHASRQFNTKCLTPLRESLNIIHKKQITQDLSTKCQRSCVTTDDYLVVCSTCLLNYILNAAYFPLARYSSDFAQSHPSLIQPGGIQLSDVQLARHTHKLASHDRNTQSVHITKFLNPFPDHSNSWWFLGSNIHELRIALLVPHYHLSQ